MPKYSETEDDAGQDLQAAPEGGDQAQDQPAKRTDTFFISPDHLGQHLDPESVKPGDILEFKVVGRDAEGDFEVEYNAGNGGESGMDKMKTDLADHMASSEAEPGPGSNY